MYVYQLQGSLRLLWAHLRLRCHTTNIYYIGIEWATGMDPLYVVKSPHPIDPISWMGAFGKDPLSRLGFVFCSAVCWDRVVNCKYRDPVSNWTPRATPPLNIHPSIRGYLVTGEWVTKGSTYTKAVKCRSVCVMQTAIAFACAQSESVSQSVVHDTIACMRFECTVRWL